MTINSSEYARSELTNNTATWGGAIYQAKGELWLDAVALSGNESTWGGGLYQAGGSATLTDNTMIFGNVARHSYGKAVVKAKTATLTIKGSIHDEAVALYLDDLDSFL